MACSMSMVLNSMSCKLWCISFGGLYGSLGNMSSGSDNFSLGILKTDLYCSASIFAIFTSLMFLDASMRGPRVHEISTCEIRIILFI